MTLTRLRQCACVAPCPHHKGQCEEMGETLRCKCCVKAQRRERLSRYTAVADRGDTFTPEP